MPATTSVMRICAPWAAICLAVRLEAAQAEPGGATCDDAGVAVFAAMPTDVADACRGAADAIAFFRAARLQTDVAMEIHVRNALPQGVGPGAAGGFLAREGRILMLPYAEFRKIGTWFGVPIDRRLYRSLAAHEVAHALASGNFAVRMPSVEAHEYIAYVTMFSTMDPGLRERILAAIPETEPERTPRLSAAFHLFEPMRFGVTAYRHYIGPDGGPEYLRDILAGRAMAH